MIRLIKFIFYIKLLILYTNYINLNLGEEKKRKKER